MKDKLKILFDGQIFISNRYGGAFRLYYEVLKNIKTKGDFIVKLALNFIYQDEIKNLVQDQSPVRKFHDFESFLFGLRFKGKSLLYRKLYKRIVDKSISRFVKKQIESADFDVFHPTYYDTYFLNYLRGKPFVVTVLDMIHEKYSEYYPLNKVSENKKLLVMKAARIIAISETTKRDLIDYYKIPENKIDVVYLGNSLDISNPQKIEGLPAKYILFVGKRKLYKNFVPFVQSIKSLLLRNPGLSLVCTGDEFDKDELDFFEANGILAKVSSYFVNNNELCYLYKNAELFVFPSKYEGFGIPVLESFACGCPTVLSNCSALKEVGGDSAVYFDPESIQDMNRKIEDTLHDEGLKKQLVENGYKRVADFSWQKASREFEETYLRTIKKNEVN